MADSKKRYEEVVAQVQAGMDAALTELARAGRRESPAQRAALRKIVRLRRVQLELIKRGLLNPDAVPWLAHGRYVNTPSGRRMVCSPRVFGKGPRAGRTGSTFHRLNIDRPISQDDYDMFLRGGETRPRLSVIIDDLESEGIKVSPQRLAQIAGELTRLYGQYITPKPEGLDA